MKRNAGITLIALIVTIVVLLILASATINLLFGDNNLIDQAKWSAFATDLSRVKEAVLLSQEIDSNGQYYFNVDNVFDGLYDERNISDSLKKDIVEARENKKDSGYSQDTVNVKYEALKNSEGKINGLYYVNKTISGKEKAYLFDTETNTVFDVKGRKIYRADHHMYRIGEAGPKPLTIAKPEGADLSEHKDLEEDWIPIYTLEQLKKVATEEENYEIRDLNNTVVGNYTMATNGKYRMMNDIEFTENATYEPISGLNGGIFDGNGYYLKNFTISTNSKEYDYYSQDIFTGPGNLVSGVIGIFDRVIESTIQNVGIDNANVVAQSNNVGVLVGEIVGSTIENCIIKNSSIDHQSTNSAAGILVGRTYNTEIPTKISKIEINNVNVEGKSTLGGIIGLTATNIEISNCIVENSTIKKLQDNSQSIGGIVGLIAAPDETIITDCYVGKTSLKTLNDNITTSGSSVSANTIGGIVGGTCYSLKGKIDITNCSVEELDFGCSGNAGGIMGLEYGSTNELLETNIDKCNVKDVSIRSFVSGGVLAYNRSGNTNITNCNVRNFKTIENWSNQTSNTSNNNVGGVLGYTEELTNVNIENCNVADVKMIGYGNYITFGGITGGASSRNNATGTMKISGCSVNNIQLLDALNSGGILGFGRDIGDLNVLDCSVSNYTTQSYSTGGIIGNLDNIGDYEIFNCEVNKFINGDRTFSLSDYTGRYIYHIGGIIGWAQEFLKGKIIGCNVLNSNIYVYSSDNRNADTAGIAGGARVKYGTSISDEDVLIKNCKVENSTIETKVYGKNDSSMFHASGIANYSSFNIEGCEVNKCHILLTAMNHYEGSNYSSSGERNNIDANGIVSCAYDQTLKINNCILSETEISTNYGSSMGILSYSDSDLEISNININNCDIYAKYSAAGVSNYNWHTCNIDKVNVNNTNITSEVRQAGGIFGMADYRTTISNCNVTNCKIENKMYEETKGLSTSSIPGAGNVGGIAGQARR